MSWQILWSRLHLQTLTALGYIQITKKIFKEFIKESLDNLSWYLLHCLHWTSIFIMLEIELSHWILLYCESILSWHINNIDMLIVVNYFIYHHHHLKKSASFQYQLNNFDLFILSSHYCDWMNNFFTLFSVLLKIWHTFTISPLF